MAGKWTTGSRQQKLIVPKRMLYYAQWEAGVAVAETYLFLGHTNRKLRGEMSKQRESYVLNLDQEQFKGIDLVL